MYTVKKKKGRYRIIRKGWIWDTEIYHTRDGEFAYRYAAKLNSERGQSADAGS